MEEPLNKIGEPTCTLIRRDCFDKLGSFNNSLEQILDFEMWYRIMTKYHIAFIDEKLCSFRLHENQTSQKNESKQINDYTYLEQFLYNDLYPFLHPQNKKALLKKHHSFFKFTNKVRYKLGLRNSDET